MTVGDLEDGRLVYDRFFIGLVDRMGVGIDPGAEQKGEDQGIDHADGSAQQAVCLFEHGQAQDGAQNEAQNQHADHGDQKEQDPGRGARGACVVA